MEKKQLVKHKNSTEQVGDTDLNVTSWLVMTAEELDTSILSSSSPGIRTTVPRASSNSRSNIRT